VASVRRSRTAVHDVVPRLGERHGKLGLRMAGPFPVRRAVQGLRALCEVKMGVRVAVVLTCLSGCW
jgi:hypothetical protein